MRFSTRRTGSGISQGKKCIAKPGSMLVPRAGWQAWRSTLVRMGWRIVSMQARQKSSGKLRLQIGDGGTRGGTEKMNGRIGGLLKSDIGILVLLALLSVAAHTVTNGQYGFHRDELQTLDDARHLDWGFVAYPPVTPLIGRIELTL